MNQYFQMTSQYLAFINKLDLQFQAIILYNSGIVYFGDVEILNEKVIKQGQGIIFFENQNVYVGDFKNNLREGKGQLLKIID